MPLVRIDLADHHSPENVTAIGESVYESMLEVANVPENDKFQVITRHSEKDLVFPVNGYLGMSYTKDIVFIQITWNSGRTVAVKKAFYKAIAEKIHAKTGIRSQDVWISLVNVEREDWSFGDGIMHYAPKAD